MVVIFSTVLLSLYIHHIKCGFVVVTIEIIDFREIL